MQPKFQSWLLVAWPTLVVSLPLLAFGFQGDEKRDVYYNAERFGTNPFPVARQVVSDIDLFLGAGNFRPLGRFFAFTQQAFLFETAEATGLAPHVAQGLLRCAVLLFLSWCFVRVIHRFCGGSEQISLGVLFAPGLLAVTFVASGAEHPIVHFPALFVLSAAAVLGSTLVASKVQLFEQGRESVVRLTGFVAVGAASAMTFDLLYLVPVFALVGLFAQAVNLDRSVSSLRGSAAVWRVASVAAGFGAVFIPTRLLIASRCAEGGCYSGSDLNLGPQVFEGVIDRAMSGLPPASWQHVADEAETTRTSIPVESLFTNSALLLLVASLVIFGLLLAQRMRCVENARPKFSATGLAVVGAALVLLPALVVSASRLMQRDDYEIGEGWRDSVLTASGWAVLAIAVIVSLQRRWPTVVFSGLGRLGLSLVLVLMLGASLFSNVQAARTDDKNPESATAQAVSASLAPFDASSTGNIVRCALAERYREISPSTEKWVGAHQILNNLDLLTLERYGLLYCDPTSSESD
jgi:hypothetical protein